nr:TonB-dependent receptor [Pseudomonadales bacterium]
MKQSTQLIGNKLLILLLTPIFYVSNATNAYSADSSYVVEEIVVTARKRTENLQDVPAAVSAFTGNELIERGVDRIEEIQRLTPNLTVNEASGLNPGAVQVFIRGIGSDPGFDQGVGIYVDDVYLNRTIGAMLELYDVERIEVLKGPQGNLYGRNTIGGALKYVTRTPNEQTRGFFEAKVGTDSLRKIKAGASGGLSDNVYGSIAVLTEDRDGYQTNLFDGDDYGSADKQAARGVLVWDASEKVNVKLTADYFK